MKAKEILKSIALVIWIIAGITVLLAEYPRLGKEDSLEAFDLKVKTAKIGILEVGGLAFTDYQGKIVYTMYWDSQTGLLLGQAEE